jgi:transposase
VSCGRLAGLENRDTSGERSTALSQCGTVHRPFRRSAVPTPRVQEIHVICDNAKFHNCSAVKEYLAVWGHRIAIHFLAKYAPETNPVERVWWHLHGTITRNHRCRILGTHPPSLQLVRDIQQPLPRHAPLFCQSRLFTPDPWRIYLGHILLGERGIFICNQNDPKAKSWPRRATLTPPISVTPSETRARMLQSPSHL